VFPEHEWSDAAAYVVIIVEALQLARPRSQQQFGGVYRRRAPVVGDVDFIFVNEQGRSDADVFHAPLTFPRGSCGSGHEKAQQ
jgi:hypothetical protein